MGRRPHATLLGGTLLAGALVLAGCGGGGDDNWLTFGAALGMDVTPFEKLRQSTKPVVSAVNGLCQGGGMQIALCSDMAVISDRATFRVPELLRGITDATYAAALPAHVGIAVARDLLFSARRFGAEEARDIGLISRVVAHDDLRDAALEATRQVLRTAPGARAQVKRMLNERYGLIDYQTMFAALEHSPEPREGMRAFMEKRPPSWIPDDVPPE